jgi:hypothetical protein
MNLGSKENPREKNKLFTYFQRGTELQEEQPKKVNSSKKNRNMNKNKDFSSLIFSLGFSFEPEFLRTSYRES